MRYLLDTNALVYVLCAPEKLSDEARRIAHEEDDLWVSIASLWEIAIKQSLGKLAMALSIPEIEAVCRERRIGILPIDARSVERIKTLPDIHRDPFDRLLVAQALEGNLAIVTRDRMIPQYPVQTIW